MSPEMDYQIYGAKDYEYDEFKDFYRDFFISLMDVNELRFNTFISRKHGVYIIDAKGAMPTMVNITDISTFQRVDGRSIFSIDKSKLGFEMLEENLPEVDCDAPDYFYDKTGCFTASINRLIESKIWKYASLDQITQEKVGALAETVSRTVINTANYVYFFSYIDGNWRLTFLDVRKPCEA